MSAKACCVKVKNCAGVFAGIILSLGKDFAEIGKAFEGVFASMLFILEHPTTNTTPEKETQLLELVGEAVDIAKNAKADKTSGKKAALENLTQIHADSMTFTESWANEG